jgi:hypothetical protein
MRLSDLQRTFTDYIYCAKPSDEDTAQVLKLLSTSTRINPHKGLEVYRKNLIFGILDCLKEIFPQTRCVLGDDNFAVFVRDLIYQAPSSNADLRQYGEKLPEYLAKRTELDELAWVVDVARVEWIWNELAYANSREERLLGSPWPLADIWTSFNDTTSNEPETIVLEADDFEFKLWRDDKGQYIKVA